jgi:hypothetical protein
MEAVRSIQILALTYHTKFQNPEDHNINPRIHEYMKSQACIYEKGKRGRKIINASNVLTKAAP